MGVSRPPFRDLRSWAPSFRCREQIEYRIDDQAYLVVEAEPDELLAEGAIGVDLDGDRLMGSRLLSARRSMNGMSCAHRGNAAALPSVNSAIAHPLPRGSLPEKGWRCPVVGDESRFSGKALPHPSPSPTSALAARAEHRPRERHLPTPSSPAARSARRSVRTAWVWQTVRQHRRARAQPRGRPTKAGANKRSLGRSLSAPA